MTTPKWLISIETKVAMAAAATVMVAVAMAVMTTTLIYMLPLVFRTLYMYYLVVILGCCYYRQQISISNVNKVKFPYTSELPCSYHLMQQQQQLAGSGNIFSFDCVANV